MILFITKRSHFYFLNHCVKPWTLISTNLEVVVVAVAVLCGVDPLAAVSLFVVCAVDVSAGVAVVVVVDICALVDDGNNSGEVIEGYAGGYVPL